MFRCRFLGSKSRNNTSYRVHLTKIGTIFTILIFAASLVVGPVTGANAASTITFTGQELLGRPTDSSIMVTVVPAETVSVYYEYGTTSGVYTDQTTTGSATGGQPYEVVISGLAPDTQYYYRMQYQKPGDIWVARSEHSFWTQRPAGRPFAFTVTSDSHVNILLGSVAQWTKTMNDVAADHPDFEIDLGDTFAMDGVTTVAAAETNYKYQYQFFNLASASAAIFLAPGNHEQQEGWHLDDTTNPALAPPVIGTNAQKKYFPNPVPDAFYSGGTNPYSYLDGDHLREDYYAWTWGDALFVVIDPYWYTMTKPFTGNTGGGETSDTGSGNRWDWTLGVEQYNWLKTTLESSTAKYKFIFAHHMTGGSDNYVRGGANPANLFEWGGYNLGGSTWGWETNRPAANGWGSQPIHQMMVANGVSAFFHGHDHQYAYEKRDGIVYQSVPTGSFTGNFGIYTTGSGYTIWADSTQVSGHLKVTVDPAQTTVDYIKTGATSSAYTYSIVSVNPTVTISKPGNQATLDWPQVATVDHYAVYRSLTAPYFAPPSAGSKLANVTTATHTFTDSTADLTVAGNTYFYVVAPMNASDQPIGASNRTGAFVYGIVSGSAP